MSAATLREMWLQAWAAAVDATWPANRVPERVRRLKRIVAHDLPFTAPEEMRVPASKGVLLREPLTENEASRWAAALVESISRAEPIAPRRRIAVALLEANRGDIPKVVRK